MRASGSSRQSRPGDASARTTANSAPPTDRALSAEALTALGRELVRFVPDVVAMTRGILADPRVPQQAKVEAGAALAYLVSPANRLTSWIPIVGQADDVAVLAFAMRRLMMAADEPVLREHWRGSQRGLDVLLGVTTALISPRGMLRRTALLGTVAGAARDVFDSGWSKGRQWRGARRGEVIDGEVLSRRHGR